MLLDARTLALAPRVDEVLAATEGPMSASLGSETHGSAIELRTAPHRQVADAMEELADLRRRLRGALEPLGLVAAVAGLHPLVTWNEVTVSSGERYQFLYGSMRELARREPTFALHVHVALPDADTAMRVLAGLRPHLPLLLALSANSPFWQGRDTGLASARTPLFQAFPRVGIPREFSDYAEYVGAIDLLLRCEAIPDPSFLWWDARLQPALGTVEVRIMDAQTHIQDSTALVALVQSVAHHVAASATGPLDGFSPEVLAENRFLAARDGMEAGLIDPVREIRRPAREMLSELVERCQPDAEELGCRAELEDALRLAADPGAARQLRAAHRADKLPGLLANLVEGF